MYFVLVKADVPLAFDCHSLESLCTLARIRTNCSQVCLGRQNMRDCRATADDSVGMNAQVAASFTDGLVTGGVLGRTSKISLRRRCLLGSSLSAVVHVVEA
jgi:hypothetical protein